MIESNIPADIQKRFQDKIKEILFDSIRAKENGSRDDHPLIDHDHLQNEIRNARVAVHLDAWEKAIIAHRNRMPMKP